MASTSDLNALVAVRKTVPIASLTVNVRYRMKNIRRVSTRYGDTVAATLQIEEQNEVMDVFLPKRVLPYFTDEILQKIPTSPPLYLIYLGKEGQFYKLKFEN